MRCAIVMGMVATGRASWTQPAYPSRPITFVVPFAAGGGGDVVARVLAKNLSERIKNPVIVDNRVGAGGNIGAAYVMKSAPSGYTLLNMSSTYAIQAAVSKLPFDPIEDMQPIVMVSRDPAVVLPDVVTFAEQGYPDYQVFDWKAVAGPKGLAADIVGFLSRELNAVLREPEVSAKFEAEGATVVGGTPEQMMQTVRSDIERWRSIVQKAKVKIE